ncbi:HD-GYP domain-containing protein [Brevibacillus formosus]|uniref:C-di-GMP phosphodiesterase n=1 Tax=Brevibacillus formosus TaxID=54913 RepID=A0A837KS20_9BACL|nr:HD-GYP domain-containing protein [Brevibacillus formosus]KLH98959.1 c-di-GMP phosphodiesterase [Brevibacillus formosus]MED1960577.1 HD-GYP domain-containing protein [Brevibacillus formosus]PSJ97982.1 HD-GYP domain-containing protein [Brevibacillus formosus]GED56729.1 HD family phosphohydrolase [Brevibacillus formosus]
MAEVKPSHSLIGTTLAQDVYNEYGLLLLPAGANLHLSDIRLLEAHQVEAVHVTTDSEAPEMPFPLLHWSEAEAAKAYMVAVQKTEYLFNQLANGDTPRLQQFSDAVHPMLDQVLHHMRFLRFIYLNEGTESYTYRHSLHVGIVAALIGKIIGLPQHDVHFLGLAGLLHDIGKMKIPDELLSKPERLTDEEYTIMKKHTVYGYELLRTMDDADNLLAQCALMHHERWDGSGYPLGRKKDGIPFECQIISVADVFDAICTDRVYRKGTSPFEAANVLWELACSGQLNPMIVSRFIHHIILLYVGSHALLNNGDHVEIIMIHTDEPMRPLVRRGNDFIDLRLQRSLRIQRMIS